MNLWEIILYWASIVALWILIGLNLWSCIRSNRAWKKQKQSMEQNEKQYQEAIEKYNKAADAYYDLRCDLKERIKDYD